MDYDTQALHQVYCAATGNTPNYRVHERSYLDFLQHDFTADDLRCVLVYIKFENQRMNGAKFSNRLDRLLDFEYRHFDSLLCEARARERSRVKPKTNRENVIEAFRKTPIENNGHAPKIIGAVLRDIAQ